MYFKKSELSILFHEMSKKYPDKYDFLMMMWNNVKALHVENEVVERHCKGMCDKCVVAVLCKTLNECKNVLEKYREVQETDQYWSDLVHETATLLERHKDSETAKTLVRSALEDLSEFSKTLPGYQKWLKEVEE